MEWSSQGIRLDVADGIAHLVLAHGESGNVLHLEAARALREAAYLAARTPDVHCLILRAEGARFCVGGDLREFAAAPLGARLNEAVARPLHDAIEALGALSAPVVCAVRGAVGGGGVGLVLAADIVVAGRSATFTVGYTASGLSPDCGVSWDLPQRIGLARAMDLILTNRRVDAVEGQSLGLVSRVVENDAVDDVVNGIARALADGPRMALAQAKRLVRLAGQRSRTDHLNDEALTIGDVGDVPDAREGIDAFLNKRKPSFSK